MKQIVKAVSPKFILKKSIMNAIQSNLLNIIVNRLKDFPTKLKGHAFKNIQKNQKTPKVSNIKKIITLILIVSLLLARTNLLQQFLAVESTMKMEEKLKKIL